VTGLIRLPYYQGFQPLTLARESPKYILDTPFGVRFGVRLGIAIWHSAPETNFRLGQPPRRLIQAPPGWSLFKGAAGSSFFRSPTEIVFQAAFSLKTPRSAQKQALSSGHQGFETADSLSRRLLQI